MLEQETNELLLKKIRQELRARIAYYKPYNKQRDFHNSRSRVTLMSGGNQRIAVDTPVLTTNGWKNAGDITYSDVLFDGDGNPTKINDISNIDGQRTFKLTFNDGSWCECDIDHRWFGKFGKGGKFKTFIMSDIINKCGVGVIPYHKRMTIPMVKIVNLPEKELPIDPYLFGHYLGNGWIKENRIMLSGKKDYYDLISSMFNTSNFYDNIKTFKVKDIDASHIDHINAKQKYIPKDYLMSSHEQRKELFIGLMDSDGSCEKDGRIRYWTSSKQLAEDVLELGRSLGCQWKINKRERKTNFGFCTEYYCSGRCPVFNPFRLKHRADRWTDKSDPKILVSIEEIDTKKGVCFAVSSPLHTYIIKDYIITHNSGKTYSACHDVAFNATGIFPDWYDGYKPQPTVTNGIKSLNIWVVGTDSDTVKLSLQAKLIGTEENNFEDGIIPKELIPDEYMIKSKNRGAFSSVCVKHKEGFLSKIIFKSYGQGQVNLQSQTVHYVYADEEPPQDVMEEITARTTATKGKVIMAFTPLLGMTKIVSEFWNNEEKRSNGSLHNKEQRLVVMNLYEAEHMTKEMIAELEASYRALGASEHVIRARVMGIPFGGEYNVYTIPEAEIQGVPPQYPIPSSWKQLGAIDFGRGTHPSAFVWMAQDPSTKIIYLYDCEKTTQNIYQNVEMMKSKDDVKYTYPHDLGKSSGIANPNDPEMMETYSYIQLYKKLGINLTSKHAHNARGGIGVETGIMEVRKYLGEGKLKVSPHLHRWFEEYRMYKYDENKIVKKDDDLLDATRYCLIMFERYASSISGRNNFEIIREYDNELDIWR